MPSEILGDNYQAELESEKIAKDDQQKSYEDPINLKDVSPQWKRANIDAKYLRINNLQFTNRSSCADDSNRPTTQVNLIIDSMNAAKSVYRLALSTGREPRALTKMGVSRFRYSSYKLIEYIANQIFEDRLPLLHADLTASALEKRFKEQTRPNHDTSDYYNYRKDLLKQYSQISEGCKLDEYCEELDQYIAKIWNNRKYSYRKQTKEIWGEIDNFSSKHFFGSKLIDEKENSNLSCHFLKKYSPFMAQVGTVAANKKVLESLAIAQGDQSEYITTCDDIDAQSSLEAVAYQLDILGTNKKNWDKAGFDFWHSLKLYYSWAFRNSQQIEQMSYPFGEVFKSIYLEESVMFFSTNCRGTSPSRCDNDFLSSQRIRDFAKSSYNKMALNHDFMKSIPNGAEKELLDDPFVDYNNDILEYGKFPDMNEWAQSFAKNIRKSRSYIKNKLMNAISTLEVTSKYLSVDSIINNLNKAKNNREAWSHQGASKITVDGLKNELYYLCSEYNVAAHETLSFIRSDLDYLKQMNELDPTFKKLTSKGLKEFYNYFEQVAPAVLSFCNELEERGIWENFEVDRSGFSDWYKELIIKDEIGKKGDSPISIWGTPLLKNRGANTVSNTICFNGSDCSRKILESITSIYSAVRYFRTFYVNDQNINDPSLINPYAERTACKIYDPWWKVKKTLFNTFSDLTAAAISLVNPTPFYLNVDYVPQRATSFNKMMKDGKLTFDPQMSGHNWPGELGVDLNKILNIPCTVSVGNHSADLLSKKAYFAGYTFKGCLMNKNGGEIRVQSASDIDVNSMKTIQGCASCTINFETMSNWVATFANIPVVSTSYYLIRGVMRFFRGFSDPIEIPRRWEINPNNVLDTYKRYGTIPKSCVKKLVKGSYCMPSKCEHAISKAAGKLFNTQVTYIDEDRDSATIKLKHCKNRIKVVDTKVAGMFCRGELTKDNFWEDSSCNFPKEKR